MFGRDPKLPVDIEFGLDSESNPLNHDYSRFVDSLNKQFEYARKLASLGYKVAIS